MNSVLPIPEGFSSVTPYLTVHDASKALEFYQQAFGAIETLRLTDPEGKIGHAEVQIGDAPVMLSDEFPGMGSPSPKTLNGSAVVLHLYVEDVDAFVSKAVDAGATVLMEVSDQFYGDRMGKLQDPFGHIWTVATHKEDVSPEELEKRFHTMFD